MPRAFLIKKNYSGAKPWILCNDRENDSVFTTKPSSDHYSDFRPYDLSVKAKKIEEDEEMPPLAPAAPKVFQPEVIKSERPLVALSPNTAFTPRYVPATYPANFVDYSTLYGLREPGQLSPTVPSSEGPSSPPQAAMWPSPTENNSLYTPWMTSLEPKEEISRTGDRFHCEDCNKSYSTYSGLSKHKQFHCTPDAQGKKSFSCKYCEKTYLSLGALKMHIRTHTLPCKCKICGKAFSRPWLLQGHIRTHTGEKPFSCNLCNRAFADRSNLRAHLQTHSDVKKYSCESCSKTFSRMSLLSKHKEGGCQGYVSPVPRTISRRLVANGLHSCRPLRRLPLTPPNRRQRLEWCRARSTWMTEWHRVVFSDESRFCLSSDSRRVRVWRRRGERSNPAAIVERPTVRQRGIMVWGAIAYDSRSPLLRIQGTMTAQRYVDDVLRPVTLPYLQGYPMPMRWLLLLR
ncbi:SNAI2 [Cordylochernes scorpioides]|uniref:SNAI2 n=1 Tax=Cordylochernes scorpioides TaxID=51811 RepID=A0ABY6KJ04_9ARAC|nr:SNAI2 [Cordylochernes scorpioides]